MLKPLPLKYFYWGLIFLHIPCSSYIWRNDMEVLCLQGYWEELMVTSSARPKTQLTKEIRKTGVQRNIRLCECPDSLRKALESPRGLGWGSWAHFNSCRQGSSPEQKLWFNEHGYFMDEDSKSYDLKKFYFVTYTQTPGCMHSASSDTREVLRNIRLGDVKWST